VVVGDFEIRARRAGERIDEGIDGAGAVTFDAPCLASHLDGGLEGTAGAAIGHRSMVEELEGTAGIEVFGPESFPDLTRGELFAASLGDGLDNLAELDLEAPGKLEAVVLLQDIGHAALSGLAVDADHSLIAAPDVGRIDRQIGHFPETGVAGL